MLNRLDFFHDEEVRTELRKKSLTMLVEMIMGKNSNIIGIQLLDLVWWKEWGIHIRLELAGVGKYSHNLIYAKL